MGTKTAPIDFCQHDEVAAACLECLAMPQKITPAPPPTPRATKSPSTAADKISPLAGDLDMSMPVTDPTLLVGSATLPARVFPHYLRKGGWVYLRNADKLTARVRASKVVWQEDRQDLVDGDRDLGPGIAIAVDTVTWEDGLNIDLGALATRQRDGFRYLMTEEDDTITHYSGGRPLPADTSEIDLR